MQYSQAEISNMRRDALRRTREMHSKSRNTGVQAALPPVPAESSESQSEKAESEKKAQDSTQKQENEHEQSKSGNVPGNPISSLLSEFLGGGKLDSDKIIIIALIFILAREGADIKLLLALGYILI